MNSAVITKIEYKLPDQENFTFLDVVPHSGKLKEDIKRTGAGNVYSLDADFLIAGMTIELSNEIKSIANRKASFRITDADDVVYLVGSSEFPARLSAVLELDGAPGSFKGYRCSISQKSPTGCTVE